MAEPAQTPFVQTSPLVQGELSLHAVPGAAVVKMQPVTGEQLSVVHVLLSLHASVPDPPQLPPLQLSPVVQGFPSLHVAVLFAKPHCPVAGSHVSVVQTLLSLHVFGVPGRHVPPPQTSLSVQPFPSSHAAVLFTNPQPVVAEQNGDVQGLLSSGHVMAEPMHAPLEHVSPLVQAELSLHAVPGGACVKVQPTPAVQASRVHVLLSLHVSVPVPRQLPPLQVSPVVQGSWSLHEAVLFVATHAPVAATQESVVHTLLSLQFFGAPGWQLPAEQTSLSVQALPSSHCAVLFMKPQPRARLHTAVVHGFESSGQMTARPTQTPFVQTSPVVQAELSSQSAPSLLPLHVTCASTSNDTKDTTNTATSERATMNSPGRTSRFATSPTSHGSGLSGVNGRERDVATGHIQVTSGNMKCNRRSHGNTCR